VSHEGTCPAEHTRSQPASFGSFLSTVSNIKAATNISIITLLTFDDQLLRWWQLLRVLTLLTSVCPGGHLKAVS
jgi:hypothetical protein